MGQTPADVRANELPFDDFRANGLLLVLGGRASQRRRDEQFVIVMDRVGIRGPDTLGLLELRDSPCEPLLRAYPPQDPPRLVQRTHAVLPPEFADSDRRRCGVAA